MRRLVLERDTTSPECLSPTTTLMEKLMQKPNRSTMNPTTTERAESVVSPTETGANSAQVAEAFDAVAEIYDYSFESSPVIQRLRRKLYDTIDRVISAGSSVLDINCGTGTDALFLANHGYNVMGIDISPKMIEQARDKVTSEKRQNVQFKLSSFEHVAEGPHECYDLVLSNFGGLNCTNDLGKVAEQLAHVTKDGGYFVGVVMPPFSIWETVAGLIHGNFYYAVRRLRRNVSATGFSDRTFSVFYHSPRELASAFRPWFSVEKVCGLSILSPPPNARSFIEKHPRLTTLLERLDGIVESFPLGRSMGDHFMIILRKRARQNWPAQVFKRIVLCESTQSSANRTFL